MICKSINILKVDSVLYTTVDRGFLVHYFMKTPYIVNPPHFFQILSGPQTPCSFCCLVSLTEWVIVLHLLCYFTLNDIMDLHMSIVGTLVPVPEGPCCLFYATRHQGQ